MRRETLNQQLRAQLIIMHPNAHVSNLTYPLALLGTAVAQWLRWCATNRKVAGSIPAGVIGIFH